jgi:hypothetical protein
VAYQGNLSESPYHANKWPASYRQKVYLPDSPGIGINGIFSRDFWASHIASFWSSYLRTFVHL